MKKVLFLIICFGIALSTTAQVRFSAALGANTAIFVPTENQDLNYIPIVMPNINLQMAIKKGESAFSGIVQVNLAPKRIGRTDNGSINGFMIEEGFTHLIGSGELLLGAAMDFEYKNVIIRPHAGIFLAFNEINGYKAYSAGFGIDTSNILQSSYEGEDPLFFMYPGINLGCSVAKKMFDNSREVALFAEAYFAPRNIFAEDFNYSWFGNDYTLQGKYHSLNIGIRIDLSRT